MFSSLGGGIERKRKLDMSNTECVQWYMCFNTKAALHIRSIGECLPLTETELSRPIPPCRLPYRWDFATSLLPSWCNERKKDFF